MQRALDLHHLLERRAEWDRRRRDHVRYISMEDAELRERLGGSPAPSTDEIIVHPNGDLTMIGGSAYRLYWFLWDHPIGRNLDQILRDLEPTEDAWTAVATTLRNHLISIARLAGEPVRDLGGKPNLTHRIRLTREES